LTFNDAYSIRFSASPFWSVKDKFIFTLLNNAVAVSMTHNVQAFVKAWQ